MSKGDISVRQRAPHVMRKLAKLENATGKTLNVILGELADVVAELPPTSPEYYHALARILEAKKPNVSGEGESAK